MFEELILQYGRPPSSVDYLFLAGLAVLTAYYRIREKLSEFLERRDVQEESDDDLEQLRENYVDDEISIEEFEQRVELILDEDARELRDVLERVDGIGPETSAAIAQEFGGVDAIEDVSRDDLEDVDDVGPSRADLILEQF